MIVSTFAIAPGFVRTSLNQDFFDKFGVDAAAKDIPLGEIAEPEDIANLVAFLVSPRGSYITGTVIPVDGGLRRYQF